MLDAVVGEPCGIVRLVVEPQHCGDSEPLEDGDVVFGA
jgi:hypothetical protein